MRKGKRRESLTIKTPSLISCKGCLGQPWALCLSPGEGKYLYYLNLISLELQCPDFLNEDNKNWLWGPWIRILLDRVLR